MSETAKWDAVWDYKIEMCLQFAAQPWLTFCNCDHRESNHIKNCVLYSAWSKASHSMYSSTKQTLARISGKTLT